MSAVVVSGGHILGGSGKIFGVPSGGGGGATPVFNFDSGFTSANIGSSAGQINLAGSTVALSGTTIRIPTNAVAHEAAGAWYVTQQNIQSFTTNFTFSQDSLTFGFFFVIQNNPMTAGNTPFFGINSVADANGEGYGDFTGQNAAIANSVGLNFGLTDIDGSVNLPVAFSSTGVYVDGGPINALFQPLSDLQSFGINLHAGHVMACNVVYDGTLLTMVLTDTTTIATARMSFPINIPSFVGANTAWVGFTGGGTTQPNGNTLLTWDYSTGFNARLTTPVISLASGTYTGAQSVTISAAAGASIWYSTNGVPPSPNAPNSTLYTGAITVSASQILQAVAIESGFTDSFVAVANYQIGAGLPRINFPTTFASAANFLNFAGNTQISGSNIAMTSSAGRDCIGAFWYPVPLDITNFTCVFTLTNPTSSGTFQGACFVIQNQSTATSRAVPVSGGPNALSNTGSHVGLGYAGIMQSAAIALDQETNSIGFWTGGVVGSESSLSPVNLSSGNPIKVTITYSGTTLAVTVIDTVTTSTIAETFTGVNLVSLAGSNIANVGFTFINSTGGASQLINNWTVT